MIVGDAFSGLDAAVDISLTVLKYLLLVINLIGYWQRIFGSLSTGVDEDISALCQLLLVIGCLRLPNRIMIRQPF